jgi:imidazolonepropionase-like amidohydrolase
MKKLIPVLYSLLLTQATRAQENMHPAPAQQLTTAIINAVVHVGNGQVIENGMVLFSNGKIIDVRTTEPIADIKMIDAKGKHLYPGLIASSTNLGLVEVNSVRSTLDYQELGDINPNIQSIYAYNTDSKVINTLRTNGILLAGIVPDGGTISGASSVVQLDAWNWEDAAYKTNNGIHMNMPLISNRPNAFRRGNSSAEELIKQGLEKVENVRRFFREAKAYHAQPVHSTINLKYEAVKGLFNQSQTLFIHCDLVKEMLMAVDVAREFNFKLAIVGGTDSWIIADILQQNNVAVVLVEPHSQPSTEEDGVDQPYSNGARLQQAGVLFTICDDSGQGFWRQRNLPFQAGTMAAYGLTKEQALASITLNAAKILGIDHLTGSLEKGKDANMVISEGDILDMKTSKVTHAFIQGREIDLGNKQTQLFEKYKYKYGIK